MHVIGRILKGTAIQKKLKIFTSLFFISSKAIAQFNCQGATQELIKCWTGAPSTSHLVYCSPYGHWKNDQGGSIFLNANGTASGSGSFLFTSTDALFTTFPLPSKASAPITGFYGASITAAILLTYRGPIWNNPMDTVNENLYFFDTCSTGYSIATLNQIIFGRAKWTRVPPVSVTINSSQMPYIPSSSKVNKNNQALAKSDLLIASKDPLTEQPISNIAFKLQSSRSADSLSKSEGTTDQNGIASASVETRDQSTLSTITVTTTTPDSESRKDISWLPARYEKSFLVTCYVSSFEGDFTDSPLESKIPGIPPDEKYHTGFLRDVKLQGSGRAKNGKVIRYDSTRSVFAFDTCERSASGTCVIDGESMAVDPQIIPWMSKVEILGGIGNRVANDKGGAIKLYRIDLYYGKRRHECIQLGKRIFNVNLISYNQ